jgi:hypothetical protein
MQQQRRTNTLPAATTEIFTNFSDRFYTRDCVPPELALNSGEIIA